MLVNFRIVNHKFEQVLISNRHRAKEGLIGKRNKWQSIDYIYFVLSHKKKKNIWGGKFIYLDSWFVIRTVQLLAKKTFGTTMTMHNAITFLMNIICETRRYGKRTPYEK